MSIEAYIKKTIAELTQATGKEIPGTVKVAFDLGIKATVNDSIEVSSYSSNRIKFTIEVKRS